MALRKEMQEYISKPFGEYCPFCLAHKVNWNGKPRLFKKYTYHCNSCGGEITFKEADILQKEYNNAMVIVENAGGHKIYKNIEFMKVSFMEFYKKSILSQRYHKVKRIPGKGYPKSCRLCDYGKNQPNDITACDKFWLEGSSDFICDSYSDKEWKQTMDMMLN